MVFFKTIVKVCPGKMLFCDFLLMTSPSKIFFSFLFFSARRLHSLKRLPSWSFYTWFDNCVILTVWLNPFWFVNSFWFRISQGFNMFLELLAHSGLKGDSTSNFISLFLFWVKSQIWWIICSQHTPRLFSAHSKFCARFQWLQNSELPRYCNV